jgi:transcriptional regulator with XRE-family HTH domain
MKISHSAPSNDIPMEVGKALRALRNERGWTLLELSNLTGLPLSTLSKVERNKMSLTYEKMVRIATSLNIDIGVLFAAAPTRVALVKSPISGRRSITRIGEGHRIETETAIQQYPAADLLRKHLVPIYMELKARSRAELGDLISHPGEEFVAVLEGAMELWTEFYSPVRLEKGDSIYFDSSMAHGYIAASEDKCMVLSINATVGWGSDASRSSANEIPQSDVAKLISSRR